MSHSDDGLYVRASYDSEPGAADDEEPRHTQFLDLTNGEGGERAYGGTDMEDDDVINGVLSEQHYYDEDAAAVVDYDHPVMDYDNPPNSGIPSLPQAPTAAPPRRADGTPGGRVVESGQEHTGRWTREEHDAFLHALKQYGKEWKKVAAKVKTRTVVQTRTHAQKYFQKLQKANQPGGDSDGGGKIDMGLASEKKPQKKKRSQQQRSTASAAHLLTHLPSIPSQGYSGAAASSAYPTHGFSAAASLSDLPPPPAYPPPNTTTSSPAGLGSYYNTSSASPDTWGGPPSMSIVAPDPEASMRRGFPEPSPAASGKRKIAELAAAQMLAGVAATASTPMKQEPSPYDGDVTPPPHDAEPIIPPRRVGMGLSLQIVNPENLGITYDETRKRSRTGAPSPTTPWDGQLEQLVSDQKMKEHAADSAELIPLETPGQGGNPFPHPVCGPGSSFGRSPLHKAVCEMDMAALHQELSDSIGAASLHRKDECGFYPIHSACSLSLSDLSKSSMACEIARLLISAGGDASAADNKRNTPLHWAARSGDADVALLLLMRNCPPDAQNDDGDTALHWALRAGQRGMRVVRVLVENGSRPAILNNTFKRALDVAAEGFVDDKNFLRLDADKKTASKGNKVKAETKKRKTELLEEKRESRSNLLLLSTQSRTLVLHHPECLEHIPKSESDWECPDRVTSIMRRVVPDENTTETTGIFPHEVSVSTEFDRAKLDFLSRVHSSDYLSFVNDLSKELSRRKKEENDDTETGTSSSVVPFTPMVQKTVMKDITIKKESHSDTSFSSGSLRAARRAAGAVQHAVDCVLVGRNRNAFCVVRPPGHHAGVKGLLAGGESCGFCIFNNVAAGALHAISDERLMCQRCAIVDIDVHHGNGTEEIVKRCHDPGKLLFFSIHLYDHDRRKNGYSFYPGTGDEDDIAHNIINVPINPLWREPVPSATTANKKSSHNTRHKAKKKAAETPTATGSVTNDDSSEAGAFSGNEVPKDCDTESETTSAKESSTGSAKGRTNTTPNMGRMAYRRAIQNRLLPSLRAFNPDLILISTGFDAAKGDVGNARHYLGGKQGMGLDLEPEDYAWTTRKILEIADICCQGRVVSVLEGGYGRTPVMAAPSGVPQSLDKAFFSECAIRHLHAMIDPYDSEVRFGR